MGPASSDQSVCVAENRGNVVVNAKILQNLHSLIGPVSENPAALEPVLELLNKTADTSPSD